MQRLSQIREHRHYETLKNSVEHRHDRRVAIFVTAATVVILLLSSIGIERARSVVASAVGMMIMIPYSLYCIYRAVIPFVAMDSYAFTEVMLDQPHSGGKNGMYFTVTLRDRMGREFQTETRTIFGNVSDPVFEDYINQKALIAYNEKTETVLVIQRIPEV